jgi:hypothetical protein
MPKASRLIVSDLLQFSRQSESINSCLELNALIEEVLAVAKHTLNINKIVIAFAAGENMAICLLEKEDQGNLRGV